MLKLFGFSSRAINLEKYHKPKILKGGKKISNWRQDELKK